jgi:enoyl-CoA hydratase/carnithine racemase
MTSSQFKVDEIKPSFWEVTFHNPPINMIDADTIGQLNALMDDAEAAQHSGARHSAVQNRATDPWRH